MRRITAIVGAIVLLLILTVPQTAQAESVTVVATEDTYASQGTANTTHGGLTYTAVNAPTGERRTYLKFSVTGIPANIRNFTATLQLWAESSSSATFTAYRVPTTWTESGLT